MNLGIFRLCSLHKGRIALLHPSPHSLGFLLVVTAAWTLGGEAPALEVFTAGALRQCDPKGRFDKLTDGLTRPERKGQLELIGGLVGNHLLDRAFLRRTQATLATGLAPALGGHDGPGAFGFKGRDPAPSYSPERNPDEYLNGDIKASLGRKPSPRNQETLEQNLKSHMRMLSKTPARVAAYFHAEHVRYAAAA